MLADLLRTGLADLRVPAPHELLHARHVDRPVVQVLLDGRQVGGEEAAVGADRVAAQRDRAGLGSVLADELERRLAGVGERRRSTRGWRRAGRTWCASRRRTDPSPRSTSSGWWTTRSGPSATIAQVVVGDDRGDLDDHVAGVVEPGHLEIHPDQHALDTTGGTMDAMGPDTATRVQHAARRRQGWSRRRSCGAGSGSWRSTAVPSRSRPTSSPLRRRTGRVPRCTRSSTRRPTPSTSRRRIVRRAGSPRLGQFLDHVDVVVTIHGYGRWGMFTSLLLGGGNRELAAADRRRAGARAARLRGRHRPRADPPELRGLHPDNPVNVPRRAACRSSSRRACAASARGGPTGPATASCRRWPP